MTETLNDLDFLLPDFSTIRASTLCKDTFGINATLELDKRSRIFVSGNQSLPLASLAWFTQQVGHQLVFCPTEKLLFKTLNARAPFRISDCLVNIDTRYRLGDEEWDVALFSSGSTGPEKIFGFTRSKLQITSSWYKDLYSADRSTVIVTSLPASYNFTYVAGIELAILTGAKLALFPNPNMVLDSLPKLLNLYDNVIILANPVVVESLSRVKLKTGKDRLLIDSGGAPLSTYALQFYRDQGIDLREGYGLTETASLTHFDSEGSSHSLGTVGKPQPGVKCRISGDEKPRIELSSPNLGVEIKVTNMRVKESPASLRTDYGEIDSNGRLKILGRSCDVQISGKWPRDTLNHLGSWIGPKTASIRHLDSDNISVRLLSDPNENCRNRLKKLLAEYLDIKICGVEILNSHSLLHSQKLKHT